MDQIVSRIVEFVSHQDNPLGLAILGVSALIEYIFPPFPGDTITLLGAFLITSRGWSFVHVFTVVLVGSAVGAMATFWLGTWLERRRRSHQTRHPRLAAQIDRLVARFERHGEVFLVINRFLPAVRSVFFVAAGMAGMRARWVFVWSLVSAALWNLVIIAVGSSVGANFTALHAFFLSYSRGVWLVLGGLALGWILWRALRRIIARMQDRSR